MEFTGAAPPLVLIIEDDDNTRDAAATYLRDQGFRVATAIDGARGLKSAVAEVPDAIVLDLGLPVIDGFETLRRLRAHFALKKVYVLVTSGLVNARDRELAFEAGCNEFLTKPVKLVTLGGALRAYFVRQGSIQPGP